MTAGVRKDGVSLARYHGQLRAEKEREKAHMAGSLVWSGGTAARTQDGRYVAFVRKPKRRRPLTEAEDNALARAARRRQNRLERGWMPYAQR